MGKSDQKILVVDDDVELATMVSRYLGRFGYQTLVAYDAHTALGMLPREPIGLVVTDLMMPYMDGITFTQHLHALPGFEELPVILITAYPSEEMTEKGMRQGVAMTLSKPLDLDKLLTLVGFAVS